MVTVTHSNSGSTKIYANGNFRSQNAIVFTGAINPVNDFVIGANSGPVVTNFFPGSIDDVRIYNRALSPAEITQLYKMGR
jgi:hypothetical protein